MSITEYIRQLVSAGQVTVADQIVPFTEADRTEVIAVLSEWYQQRRLDLPGIAPAFKPEAALWAAEYLYRSTQFILLRHLEEKLMEEHLPAYPDEMTPEAIFSVDLVFYYLIDLINLSKGLAPDDPLVKRLNQTAARWPFSTPALLTEPPAVNDVILAHPSLRREYLDRLIALDKPSLVATTPWNTMIRESLGAHQDTLWPAFAMANEDTEDESRN